MLLPGEIILQVSKKSHCFPQPVAIIFFFDWYCGSCFTAMFVLLPIQSVTTSHTKTSIWFYIIASFCCFSVSHLSAQYIKQSSFDQAEKITKTLSFEKQVAQLLMVPAWSKDNQVDPVVVKQIKQYGVGGIIWFQGDLITQAYLNNYYQQESQLPLLVGIDGEWGLSMRLSNQYKYPYPLTLGAASQVKKDLLTEEYSYRTGLYIGWECKRAGIHINFAPDIDVNTEPNNPIIGFRSFGSDPAHVAQLGLAFSKGLQEAGILACAKHFPGHGNTMVDSHKDLPTITLPLSEIEKTHVEPFRKLVEQPVASVMMGHLQVPSMDSSGLPASLSKTIINDWVRGKLGYQGLVITDALNMKGVAKISSPTEVAFMALQAGNDILLFPEDVAGFIEMAKSAKENGWLDSAEIAQRVKRVIATKVQLGLFQQRLIEIPGLTSDVQQLQKEFESVYEQEIAQKSTVNLQPTVGSISGLPWKPYQSDSILPVFIGDSISFQVLKKLQGYNYCKYPVLVNWNTDSIKLNIVLKSIYQRHSLRSRIVVFGLDFPIWGTKSRVVPSKIALFLMELQNKYRMVYLHAGHSYAIREIQQKGTVPMVIVHENSIGKIHLGIENIFGGYSGHGILPIEIKNTSSLVLNSVNNWKHLPNFIPSYLEDKDHFQRLQYLQQTAAIDSMMQLGLSEKLYPSAQLVVLKDGKLFYEKSFGYLPDSTETWVGPQQNPRLKLVQESQGNTGPKVLANNQHIYDIASVTKIAATTAAIMKLVESKGIKLDVGIGTIFPEVSASPWASLTLRELLMHRTGLVAFLPLTTKFTEHGAQVRINSNAGVSKLMSDNQQMPIGQGVWLDQVWGNKAWEWIKRLTPLGDKAYIYSDINFVILGKFIEYETGMSLDRYVDQEFYRPMGLTTLGFRPLQKNIPAYQIAPTFIDTYSVSSGLGRGLVQGYVHDPTAMFLGGVAGNAGLFSNAHDLACFMEMLRSGGIWNGKRYLKSSTIAHFTASVGHIKTNKKGEKINHYRGLGFDKVNGKEGLKNNVFEGAPESLFGHSGYTGTWAWADPESGLVFVFLSNRTFPTDTNKKLAETGFRGRLLEVVYKNLPKE